MSRISEILRNIIYFQAAVSALLAVSVLYIEKKSNEYYIIFRNFDNSTH